ncbi:MAG: tetratricopeptide repeat protein, partial [candidate division Zixibacteria bacterium]|nr:tetratricopeptide repeat protein [candidate division Zixibacteria bacterium]
MRWLPVFWLLMAIQISCLTPYSNAETWQELLHKADSLLEVQNLDSAILVSCLALERAEKEYGTEDTNVARVLNQLGLCYYYTGDYTRAETLYKRSLTVRENVLGPKHPDVAQSLNNLAALYSAQGKYEQTEPLYQRALKILEQILGPKHPDVA